MVWIWRCPELISALLHVIFGNTSWSRQTSRSQLFPWKTTFKLFTSTYILRFWVSLSLQNPAFDLFISSSAPALGSRSPPKPTSPDDENEPALVRFARLKQRESAETVASRPGGPKIITSPPKPEKWSVKDTSVNIATAFTQAATADMSTTFNHNNSWASTSRSNLVIPRSTSVEFESTASLAANRRLAPPPDKLGRTTTTTRKPPSKSVSLLQVPDSEGEDESRSNARGKSPFEQGLSIAKNALGAAAFYVRQRSREPDQPPSTNGHANGNDSSYSYGEEEQAFQAAQKRIKRSRMSTDNKAYKPSQSDEEESEWSDDGKKRKSKKKGGHGGPLNSLPTVGPYKNRKTHKGSRGNLTVGDEGHDDEDNAQTIASSHPSSLKIASNVCLGITITTTNIQSPQPEPTCFPWLRFTNIARTPRTGSRGFHVQARTRFHPRNKRRTPSCTC